MFGAAAIGLLQRTFEHTGNRPGKQTTRRPIRRGGGGERNKKATKMQQNPRNRRKQTSHQKPRVKRRMEMTNAAPKGNKSNEKMLKTTRAKNKRPTRTWPFQTNYYYYYYYYYYLYPRIVKVPRGLKTIKRIVKNFVGMAIGPVLHLMAQNCHAAKWH